MTRGTNPVPIVRTGYVGVSNWNVRTKIKLGSVAQRSPKRGPQRILGSVLLFISLAWIPAAFSADQPASLGSDDPAMEWIPYAIQLVNLAALDPNVAANLVPDTWIEFALSEAFDLEGEKELKAPARDSARAYPIGPWTTPDALAATVKSVAPRSAVSLYRALGPRLAVHCQRLEKPKADCHRAIRVSLVRLSDSAVVARSSGRPAPAITPTQRELARLGKPVVVAIRDLVRVVGANLWGPSWQKVPTRRTG